LAVQINANSALAGQGQLVGAAIAVPFQRTAQGRRVKVRVTGQQIDVDADFER
jgi:hypothetical protein